LPTSLVGWSGVGAAGPSPRAWGLLGQTGQDAAQPRSIPTCVGPASASYSVARICTVHPHVRGACVVAGVAPASGLGPSPRAWGLHWVGMGCGTPSRSIPTCVGPAALRGGD